MTTKTRRSIDLLTRAPLDFSAVIPLSIHRCCSEILRSGSHESAFFPMDRMFESQNIESMKKMMLIQEEIFKQQVHELHRLYNLQKKLMQELENGLTKRRNVKIEHTDTNSPMFSAWHQTALPETGHNFQAFIARDDPKDSCSGDLKSMTFHLSENRKDSKRIDDENDVEVDLTLSIGHCTRRRRSRNESDFQELGSSSGKTKNSGDEYGEPSSSVNNGSSEKTRPHWLLQDLSLDRT